MATSSHIHCVRAFCSRLRSPFVIAWWIACVVVGLSGPQPALARSLDDVYLPLVDVTANAAPEPSEIVPNQYIITLQDVTQDMTAAGSAPEATSVAEEANALAAQFGGQVLLVYESALRGFAATFPAESIPALEAHPSVAAVEPDRVIELQTTQPNPTWGLDRIDQRQLPLDQSYTYNFDGTGVHVYIIDTGIRASHSEFSGRVGNGVSLVFDGRGTNDCNGHGTHVAGTVGGTTYGVAKGVTLHPVRVINCWGSGFVSLIIAGIDWVTAKHNSPAVANMSLGGFPSKALDSAVRNSIAAGVTYAIAAGNSDRNACYTSPARVGTALTVGASTIDDRRASFSNFSSCLDLFAPGQDITSAWIGSDTATNTISGTSMAAPHVAGAAALLLDAYPTATPAQVAAALVTYAAVGQLSGIGFLSPNRLLNTSFIPAQPASATP